MSDCWLAPLEAVLDARIADLPIVIRDDDAGWAPARLDALLDAVSGTGSMVDLAVIPMEVTPPLADQLNERVRRGEVRLHQHGYTHANHEPTGRACEFGPSRSREQQLDDIRRGQEILNTAFDDTVDPIFTPPWNRCTSETGACLLALGFRVLSREHRADALAISGLAETPIHVDWMAKTPGGRIDRREIGLRLADAARSAPYLGVMLHHAVMDRADLANVASLCRSLARHPRARFSTLREVTALVS